MSDGSGVLGAVGGFTVNATAWLGDPSPARFSATILKSHSWPSCMPVTVKVVPATAVGDALVHLVANLSFFSTMYPVISAPPSDSGGDHFRVTSPAFLSVMSGVLAAPGASAKHS